MNNLKYFQSVSAPEEQIKALESIESILQQEHNSNGSHPRASTTQDGFMTAELVALINNLQTRITTLEATVAAL